MSSFFYSTVQSSMKNILKPHTSACERYIQKVYNKFRLIIFVSFSHKSLVFEYELSWINDYY